MREITFVDSRRQARDRDCEQSRVGSGFQASSREHKETGAGHNRNVGEGEGNEDGDRDVPKKDQEVSHRKMIFLLSL